MKTVLLVNSSGAHYFRRDNGTWQHIEQPEHKDKLWVIADLSEETLEAFKMPPLFGRDRSNLLKRRLAAAFPHSQYRAAPIISGGMFSPPTALINGLTIADTAISKLDKQDIEVVGVWGMAMLLTLLARHLSLADVVLALPSERNLRILVIKEGIPVLTRCVRRYREDEDDDDNDAHEIMRTSQHLENRRIFEHDATPPTLYLGDDTSSGGHLTRVGLHLLPLPEKLSPAGDAGYLQSIFEYVISSPRGQLAPLHNRTRYLARKIRHLSYAGCIASLLVAALFGQEDFRMLLDLQAQENILRAGLKLAASERESLANRISATGSDPALVRQATLFAAQEIDAAPNPESIFQFAATAISGLPQVRIKSMTYRFPRRGERYCQGHAVIELPLLDGRKIELPLPNGSKLHESADNNVTAIPLNHAELQFTIMMLGNPPPAAQLDIRKRISSSLKADKKIQLMHDPAVFSLINTLKGGIGMNTTQSENLWCMSIPWKNTGNLP